MNRPIMNNNENDVIRYLMNEMDPSQEVLMERAMMEDDDLLIEVESMRQTLKRLDDLPEKEPPQELTDAILEQAAAHQNSWYNQFPTIPKEMYKYAAVLLVGVGLSSGFWWATGSSNNAPEVSQPLEAASAEVTLPSSYQPVAKEQTEVEPWVDRNNVLYYQDKFNTNSTAYKSLIQASMKKVTPLQGPPTPSFRSRNLQMAGAHK